MSQAPSGWYPKPGTNEIGYWDGNTWLEIPAPEGSRGSTYPNDTFSGFAIASFVTAFLFFPLAIIFGHIALAEIKKAKGNLQGEGLAIAGLILGYLWIIGIIFILLVGFAVNDAISSPNFWST